MMPFRSMLKRREFRTASWIPHPFWLRRMLKREQPQARESKACGLPSLGRQNLRRQIFRGSTHCVAWERGYWLLRACMSIVEEMKARTDYWQCDGNILQDLFRW